MKESGNFLYDLEWDFNYWYFTIFHPRYFFSLELWQILLFFCHGSSHTRSQRGCSFALSCKCKVLYFNSDTCRGSLTSSSLQPEQFKPSTQTAVTDPINHLVEAEFCMISPCGDPKIFHGGVSFPYKKSCYMILCCSFLLFIFCSSVLFIIHC